MDTNIVTVAFNGKKKSYASRRLWQWDKGQVLIFTDIDLPNNYQVHFANCEQYGEALIVIGDEHGVDIPDCLLETGHDIYAFIYLQAGPNDAETVREAILLVNPRAKPTGYTPDETQQNAIDDAILRLNEAEEELQNAMDSIESDITTALQEAKDSGEFDGVDGSTIWYYNGTPSAPNYTFSKFLMTGTPGATQKVGDIILAGEDLYKITVVYEFTVLASYYLDMRGYSPTFEQSINGAGNLILQITDINGQQIVTIKQPVMYNARAIWVVDPDPEYEDDIPGHWNYSYDFNLQDVYDKHMAGTAIYLNLIVDNEDSKRDIYKIPLTDASRTRFGAPPLIPYSYQYTLCFAAPINDTIVKFIIEAGFHDPIIYFDRAKIGNNDLLETESKSIVGAINEVRNSAVLATEDQNFTEEEKQTARWNIGAASLADLGTVFTLRGELEVAADLPEEGNIVGDVYFISSEYVGYVWLETDEHPQGYWEELGPPIDFSGFATTEDLALKVDKENGKGLSSNDYTTSEKEKLANIATGAEVNAINSIRAWDGLKYVALPITDKHVDLPQPIIQNPDVYFYNFTLTYDSELDTFEVETDVLYSTILNRVNSAAQIARIDFGGNYSLLPLTDWKTGANGYVQFEGVIGDGILICLRCDLTSNIENAVWAATSVELAYADAVFDAIDDVENEIGDMSSLNTSNKSTIVDAINEIAVGAVAADQGVANAGKFLTVGQDGVVVPVTVPNANGVSF